MTEVIWFASKEDGAKYYRGENSLYFRRTFNTTDEAAAFAIMVAKHLKGDEHLLIKEETNGRDS